ncbi:MAG: LuxR C-terminal-related transcriptional regulator [Xanthobacteraceae bacterium]|nr:LuxR C-terminal-related transcriptional regulator [Xanthobacteraceae bacterium]
MASLLSGDGRFDVQLGVDDGREADVILADRVPGLPRPLIVIDDERPPETWGGEVRAVLPPTVDGDLLRAAVVIVAAGFTISETERLHGFSEEHPGPTRPLDVDDGEKALTPREHEVLSLLAHGASNKVIARELRISVHTAKFHVASVLAKLGARNRSDAVAIGIRRGLILL